MLLLIRAVYAEQFFTISPVYGPSHQRVFCSEAIEYSARRNRRFQYASKTLFFSHSTNMLNICLPDTQKKTPIVLVTWWAWEMKANQDTDRELMFLESSGF